MIYIHIHKSLLWIWRQLFVNKLMTVKCPNPYILGHYGLKIIIFLPICKRKLMYMFISIIENDDWCYQYIFPFKKIYLYFVGKLIWSSNILCRAFGSRAVAHVHLPWVAIMVPQRDRTFGRHAAQYVLAASTNITCLCHGDDVLQTLYIWVWAENGYREQTWYCNHFTYYHSVQNMIAQYTIVTIDYSNTWYEW